MNETFIEVFKYIVEIIHLSFAEVSIIFFLLGLVFFLLGIIILFFSLLIRIIGKRFSGKVIGAIKDVRFKEKKRDGEIIKEKKENYHAVFEYVDEEGVTQQRKSSNGGLSVLKYKTGQEVGLIVHKSKKHHDIYDAKDHSSFIMGGIFFLVGFGIIYQSASFYASLGISTLALIVILITLVFKFIGGRKEKAKLRKKQNIEVIKDPMAFNFADVRPIEELATEEKALQK